MNKEEYVKLFSDAILASEESVLDDYISSFATDIDEEYGSIYFTFEYQIDDRVSRSDEDVELNIKKILGSDYGVSVDRMDAFPNGYASYKITIDS